MNIKRATFAGGCFWCMVKPFDQMPGVRSVVVGYTGGRECNPTYQQVCNHQTSHCEGVQITYDEEVMPYEQLVEIFFRSIDPTDPDGQFHDRGPTYRTAIFYHDEEQKEIAKKYKEQIEERKIFDQPIVVPILPATVFYPAEEEHQDYYLKYPMRYGAYYRGSGRERFIKEHWYKKGVKKEQLQEKLTPMQYKVTQQQGTEPPYQNEYYDHQEVGIYVDIVSGKPLFSSKDKFDSGCGWPSFAKPIQPNALYEEVDRSHGMERIEVRSSYADSHLGHVFDDGPEQLGGLRYCINSAALRFIPKNKMEEEGYGEYLAYV